MGSNGASGGGGNTGNNRENARSRSQVNTGMSRSSASTGTSNVGGSGDGGGNNNGNQVVQAPKVTSPTTAEVSQAAPEVTSEEARASANELILKKRRGRGRSLNMLQTSSQGLDNKGLTLGKKTLLG